MSKTLHGGHQRFVDRQGQPLDLVLYTTPTCAYCHIVLRKAKQLGFELSQRDASEPAAYRELMLAGGMSQVPCLVVNGHAMYESRDIVAYLEGEVRLG